MKRLEKALWTSMIATIMAGLVCSACVMILNKVTYFIGMMAIVIAFFMAIRVALMEMIAKIEKGA